MQKLLKFTFISIGCLILAAFSAFAILIFLFDPNHYKAQIAAEIHQRTGYLLAMDGEVHWSLSPTPGLAMTNVKLTSPTGDNATPTIQMGEIAIYVKILPLFNKHIEVSGIYLENLDVLMDQNTDPSQLPKKPLPANKAAKPSAATSLATNKTSLTTIEEQETKPFSFRIHHVKIKNAHFRWRQPTTYPDVTLVSLDAKNISLDGNPFPLSAKVMLNHQQTPYSGEMSMSGHLIISGKNKNYALDKAKLTVALNSTLANGRKLALKSSGMMNLSYPNPQFSVSDWDLAINNLALKGNMEGKLTPHHKIQGSMDVQAFNLYEFLQSLGYEINTSDPAVLDKVKGNFLFNLNDHQFSLHEIKTNIDNTQVLGQLDFSNTPPTALNFNLNFEKLNLNRILPAEIGQKTVTTSDFAIHSKTQTTLKTSTQSDKILEISNSTTQKSSAMDTNKSNISMINGQIAVGQLLFGNFVAEQFKANIKRNHTLMTISPINAQFYGGQYHGSVNIDLKNISPAFTTTQHLQNVQLQMLGKTLNNSLTGSADIDANLSFNGATQPQMLKSLSGNMIFEVKNGSIQGGDMLQLLNDAYLDYKSKKKPTTTSIGKVTDFEKLHASLQLENGFARCQDLIMESSLLHVTGNGNINLQTQKIDFSLEAFISDMGISELAKLQKMMGGSIPLKVVGDLNHPQMSVDYSTFLSRLAKSQLNKKLDKLGAQMGISKDTGDDVKTQLKGLGKQLKTIFHP